jgi:hypothetical protein
MLEAFKEYFRKWRERRFLKKHGCKKWEEYNRIYDPDYDIRATNIKSFYHGYPYVYCFENHNHSIYDWGLGYDGSYVVNKWCRENLDDKFRFDFLRVLKASSTANQWEINELGGGDYIFFACKNPKDYTIFLLKWS